MKSPFRENRVSASGRILVSRIVRRWQREDEARARGPNAWRRLAAARRVAQRAVAAVEQEDAA